MYTRTFGKWQLVKPYYGETVECMLEPGNFHDRYTVTVEKDGIIIGYLQRKESHVRALYLKTGRTVQCTVTGRQLTRLLGKLLV